MLCCVMISLIFRLQLRLPVFSDFFFTLSGTIVNSLTTKVSVMCRKKVFLIGGGLGQSCDRRVTTILFFYFFLFFFCPSRLNPLTSLHLPRMFQLHYLVLSPRHFFSLLATVHNQQWNFSGTSLST